MGLKNVLFLVELCVFLLSILVSVGADDSTTKKPKIKYQSPIALNTKKATEYGGEINLVNYRSLLRSSLTNNGHTIIADLKSNSSEWGPTLLGLPRPFVAKQFHFHWGSKGVLGSEHEINGMKTDIEIHIVHIDPQYSTIEEAMKNKFGILVLGILFAEGPTKETTTGLIEICDMLPSLVKYKSTEELPESFTLQSIVEAIVTQGFVNKYFQYQGSLTTPEYAENVIWVVSNTIPKVPYECLEKFWSIEDSHDQPLINNFRELQPLNKRRVLYYNNGH